MSNELGHGQGELIGNVALDDLLHAAANPLDELSLIALRQPHIEKKRRRS
ncbi:hypothetical protein [Paraburkholderia lycopersici]|nr:hypothetical protein [Paraburkholderia lycopersici]